MMMDFPVLGDLLRRRYEPVEGYGFWDHHFPGFSSSFRDLRSDDVSVGSRESIRRALAQLVTEKRPRLILKVTGWPRVGFLREVFPEAKFIHVVRDGRSVAASLLEVSWWRGWEGPNQWRFGPLTSEESQTWEEYERSFVALAGIEWNKIIRAIQASRSLVPAEDWHTVRYEDFCSEPKQAFETALDAIGLSAPRSYLRFIEGFGLESRNVKWKQKLTPSQQKTLNKVVSDKLSAYGYSSQT